jgi:hypothetical protein
MWHFDVSVSVALNSQLVVYFKFLFQIDMDIILTELTRFNDTLDASESSISDWLSSLIISTGPEETFTPGRGFHDFYW